MNEEAYTPQVISTGPFHHDNKNFQILEKYKVRYLENFMRRARTNLENLVRIVKALETEIRQCYAETIELDSDEFVTMILLDAAFIIEYFLRDMFPVQWTNEDRTVIKPWITARMQLDFLLLENQLPFFILNDLYQLVLVTDSMYRPFIEVAFHYFGFLNTQNKPSDSNQFNQIIHFVDLIRIFYLPPPDLSERQPDSRVEKIYCATKLAEAGLTFKKSESQCYLKLKYHEGGVLEIPRFTIDNTTEIFARNLMALEQCHYPTQAYIIDYFLLLDFLCRTTLQISLRNTRDSLLSFA
ncbi:UPF0481 protein At3g47200-like [Juglans regia]|uniref:UPF0481 protein At3g47200-like n=1 Tax=Juglans regia TaxID=51240 RepID=A0A2I4EXT5_JUGRE|nr:UPF0481 protein At3g47200-like [Juglans regia]